jgi:pimeloyl-ACP methyl ester carboxylesterase
MIWWPILPILALAGLLGWLYRSPSSRTLASHPQPTADYQEALDRFQALAKTDAQSGPLFDICHSRLLTHGGQTEHAMVLLHGFTNCPEQFGQLGERFFELGYNVLIPRLPYHGYVDQMTDDLQKLTLQDTIAYGDAAVDIAAGLGHRVSVMGLSAGGVVAAWLVQNRADVDYAIPIAATFGASFVPAWLTRPMVRLLQALPDRFVWWDPRTKADNPYSVYYAYTRYPMHALLCFFQIGIAVQREARRAGPAGGQVLMITNAHEPAVNNPLLDRLTRTWRRRTPDRVHSYTFERELCLPHDLITPGTPGLSTEMVYDRLVEQVQRLHRTH